MGGWLLSRRDGLIVARHEVPGNQGFIPGKDAQSASAPKGLVPEGRYDRSLARSAWDGGHPKQPSRRVRYDSYR
jgi:hypothetical protein